MGQSTDTSVSSRSRKQIAFGIVFLIIGLAVLIVLAPGTAGAKSTLALASRRGGTDIPAPDLIFPTMTSLVVSGCIAVTLGIWQIMRPFRRINLALILIAGLGLLAFLIWASRGKSINVTGMLVSSVVRATPIALAALSGIWSERSGVVNIGIEGMMLGGAFASVVAASISGNLFMGILVGIGAGVLLALLHAALSIRYRVNQIISGTVIIILALGLTSYLQRAVLNLNPTLNQPGPAISSLGIPLLWSIPVLGPVLFNQSPIIYMMVLMLAATHIIMYYTKWGLRIRSVGEHPKAADTLGIDVYRTRYICLVVSGAVAGLAGSYMSIGAAGRFNEGMTAGKGFLGLAAMIFGNWNPGGAAIGSLLFGFFDSWQEKLAILQVGVSTDLLGMAPYLATMIVLAGVVGKARAPAADGEPYEKQ
ncbi:MAG: ABC transporter permease [Chloroflexi bacterium]|nr:ABC transporter permease [Chloroflexota bacterium]